MDWSRGRLTLAGRTGSELRERSQRGVACLPPPSGGPCSAVNSPSSQTDGNHRLLPSIESLAWDSRALVELLWPLPRSPSLSLSFSSPAAPELQTVSICLLIALPACHTGLLKPTHPNTKDIVTCWNCHLRSDRFSS